MRMSAALVRLYPPAIRRRWGSDIEREVELAGPRSWPDTITGAGRLWLHPGDWPETGPGQTSRVVATALAALAVALTLVLRATGPTPLTADIDQPATSVWLLPILLGLVTAAPLPGPSTVRLMAVAARGLVPSVLALTLLYLAAHVGPLGLPRPLLLGYYWATLGFVGIHLCLLTARVGRIAVMPGPRRLHLALLAIGAGLAFAAVQILATAVRTSVDVGLLLLAGGLALSAAAVLVAGHDVGSARPDS
ncbi:MAG TPA: hypothetical protein VL652_09710 [Kutzneria sp.]|jgi:hypothetical protein|nr:hypothetical protein [Kutzneria sp.]